MAAFHNSSGPVREKRSKPGRVKRARRLIASCRCTSGCPACVGPVSGDDRERRALLAAKMANGGEAPEKEETSGVFHASDLRGRKALALLLVDAMLPVGA